MNVYDRIRDPKRVFLICEIGANHDGDFDTALRLMDIAKKADADAVKFQSFLAAELLTRNDPDFALLKRLELKQDWYPRLKQAADERGLIFFSTSTNSISLRWLAEAGVALTKIPSPNLTHIPIIEETARIGVPAIISTGLAGLSQIEEAINAFRRCGNDKIALMHCITRYPTPPEDAQIRIMTTLATLFPQYPVGYSCHTMNIAAPLAAVALGARLIEKHLTYDRKAPGPDHHYALEPSEFIQMAQLIRLTEVMLGSGELKATPSDEQARTRVWRSLRAARSLDEGAILKREDIAILRPNDGLHPRHLTDVQGMRLARPLKDGEAITWDCFRAR